VISFLAGMWLGALLVSTIFWWAWMTKRITIEENAE